MDSDRPVLSVACPACHAEAGEPCIPLERHSELGRQIVAAGICHSERYEAQARRDAGVIR